MVSCLVAGAGEGGVLDTGLEMVEVGPVTRLVPIVPRRVEPGMNQISMMQCHQEIKTYNKHS